MQRLAALSPRMAAPRGLAVDGDDVGVAVAQALDPGRETAIEQLGVERVDHVVERVVGRQPALVRQETPQKIQPLLAP